jgi:hypothetical protein
MNISVCAKLLHLVGWSRTSVNGADQDSVTGLVSTLGYSFLVASNWRNVSSIL